MTGAPDNATVLNITALSNFAQVDHVELLVDLPRLVTVPAVQTELAEGVETHPYLEHALAVLEEDIPVVDPSSQAHEIEQLSWRRLTWVKPRHWQLQTPLLERSSLTMVMHVRLRTSAVLN